MQALELVLTGVIVLAGHVIDGCQRLGVVRGELWEHGLRCRQQLAGARQIRNIGVNLTGVHGIAFQTVHLGTLDLAVPIGAFHQAYHDAVTSPTRQIDYEIDHVRCALLISLDHKTDAVPTGQRWIGAQPVEQVERDFEAIGLFGIDVQADVVAMRQLRQSQYAGLQLAHDAVLLCPAVTRVQGRQLDRNARAFVNAPAVRRLADGVNRLHIGVVIDLRVFGRGGGFAQHVVGITESARLELAAVGQRFGDGLAGDELLAHHPHGHVHALADDGFAALADQTGQGTRQRLLAAGGHQFAGQHQPPGGRIDEHGRRLPDVSVPVASADLVADQGVTGAAIGNAQQGFGQTHQRDAFLAGQRKLLHQCFDAAMFAFALVAQGLHQLGGQGLHFFALGRSTRLTDQQRHAFGFRTPVGRGDGRTQHRLRRHRLRKR